MHTLWHPSTPLLHPTPPPDNGPYRRIIIPNNPKTKPKTKNQKSKAKTKRKRKSKRKQKQTKTRNKSQNKNDKRKNEKTKPIPKYNKFIRSYNSIFPPNDKSKFPKPSGSNQCHTNPFLGSGQSLTRQRLPSHRNEHAYVSNFYKPSGSNTCHTKPSLGSPASKIFIYAPINKNNIPDPTKKVEPSGPINFSTLLNQGKTR